MDGKDTKKPTTIHLTNNHPCTNLLLLRGNDGAEWFVAGIVRTTELDRVRRIGIDNMFGKFERQSEQNFLLTRSRFKLVLTDHQHHPPHCAEFLTIDNISFFVAHDLGQPKLGAGTGNFAAGTALQRFLLGVELDV